MEKKKVLIMDKGIDFCLLMKWYLTKKNCDVNYCLKLEEGLEDIQTRRPNIIIADLEIAVNVREVIEFTISTIEGYSARIFILDSGTRGSPWQFFK